MLIRIGDYEFLPTQENLLEIDAYWQVYRCKKTNTQEEYCVMIVNKASIKDILAESLNRETDILKQIQTQNCDNLVQTYDVIDYQDYLYIIMEICDYDLKAEFDMLKKQNTWYTEDDQIEIIQQIVKGFQSLYLMNIIHRDIKPQNILVKIIHKGTLQQKKIYKITDFGFSRFVDDLMKKQNFPPSYAAPQLFFEDDFSGRCDIYSYGVVFYIIAHQGQTLTPSKASLTQLKNFLLQIKTNPVKCQIQEGKYKLELSNLIERMLVYSEEDRIDFEEIFNHPVMKIGNIKNQEIVNTVLVYFHSKFLFFQHTMKQFQVLDSQNYEIDLILFNLFQLGLIQLNYALAIMHADIVSIHECFRENNDMLYLIEILEKCKVDAQQTQDKIRKNITKEYFKWQREFFDFKNYLPSEFKGKAPNQKVNEKSIYQSLYHSNIKLPPYDILIFRKFQSLLKKASRLESYYPVENYFQMNAEQLKRVQQLIIQ